MSDKKKLIKNIFSDILFLYKNFIHWNLSKICINIASFLLGIVLALPFFLLLLFLMWIDPLVWSDLLIDGGGFSPNFNIADISYNGYFFMFLEILLVLVWIGVFFLGNYYKSILTLYLNKYYLKREKLDIKKNLYLKKDVFFKYVKILSWQWLYLLIPFLFLLAGIILIKLIFVGDKMLSFSLYEMTPFSILALIVFLGFIFLLVFLVYRLFFTSIIFVDWLGWKEEKSAKDIVKASFHFTKSFDTFFSLVISFVLFWALLFPFVSASTYLEKEETSLKTYFSLLTKQVKEEITLEELEKLENYELSYDGENLDTLMKKMESIKNKEMFLAIFIFLVFGGYMDMVFYSFYRHYEEKEEKKSILSFLKGSLKK